MAVQGKNNTTHISFVAPTVYHYYQRKGFGGAELQVVQLAKMFAAAGYRVTILTNDFGQAEEEVHDGVRVLKVPLRFLGGSNCYFLPDSIRFVWKLVKLAPDYCLLKSPNAALFFMALAAKINQKIKCIRIFASDADCNVKGCSVSQMLYRLGTRWTKFFVFQTFRQQKMAKEKLGKDGVVIRNIFYPPESSGGEGKKDLDVLWVGSFDSNKNPEGFYEAARALPQYRFGMIAKEVPESYQTLLKKITALPNVHYFGRIPFQETQQYFSRSRIYLCTSVVEGFPNTFLQAWFSRIPVLSLTFPCDGILTQYGTGKVSGSQENLVKDIDLFLSDPQLRKSAGEKGWNYVAANHLPEKILENYRELLKMSL